MELREALILYKNYTINLIDIAKKEEFDFMEESLNDRENILNIINGLEFNALELSNIIKELGIMVLEEDLKVIMTEKKDLVRKEIEKTAHNQNANRQYGKKDYTKPSYFNEKI